MKKGFFITLLASIVLLTGCGTKEEIVEKEYFDFTPTEIVSELEDCLIDFTPMGVVDNEEKAEKIATYSSQTDVFNTNKDDIDAMIHYQFNYDDTTHKVSHISFFMDRNSTKAAERYLYHIYSIASCIDPTADTDEISAAITKGFNELDFAIYKGKCFELGVGRNDEFFTVSFTPIKNSKSE